MSIIEMTPEWVNKMIDTILTRLSELPKDAEVRSDLQWALGYYLSISAEQNQNKKGNN